MLLWIATLNYSMFILSHRILILTFNPWLCDFNNIIISYNSMLHISLLLCTCNIYIYMCRLYIIHPRILNIASTARYWLFLNESCTALNIVEWILNSESVAAHAHAQAINCRVHAPSSMAWLCGEICRWIWQYALNQVCSIPTQLSEFLDMARESIAISSYQV